jgi:peptidoglycan/LPS O-acetylase OafA/YrhL
MSKELIRPLTALRFYAALLVFSVHVTMLPGLEWLYVPIQGKVGVSVFFVLSGFVMSHVYYETEGFPITWRNSLRFYISRVTKIYPLHMLTFFLALPLGLNSETARVVVGYLPFHLTLTNLFSPVPDLGPSPNKVAWTLSCEMFFYLLTPPLFLAMHRLGRSKIWLLGLMLAAIAGLSLALQHRCNVYMTAPFRWADYLAGVGTFLLYRRLRRALRIHPPALLIGGCLYFALLLAAHRSLETYVSIALLMLPGSVLVVLGLGLLPQTRSWWLTSDSIVLLGNASFALYIVHELCFRYGRVFMDRCGLAVPPRFTIVAVVLSFVLVQGLAVALHLLYELPIQNKGRRWLARLLQVERGDAWFLSLRGDPSPLEVGNPGRERIRALGRQSSPRDHQALPLE